MMRLNEGASKFLFLIIFLLMSPISYAGDKQLDQSKVRKYFAIFTDEAYFKKDANRKGYYDISLSKAVIFRALDRPSHVITSPALDKPYTEYPAISRNELIREWKEHQSDLKGYYPSGKLFTYGANEVSDITGIRIHDIYLSGEKLHLIVTRSDLKSVLIKVGDFKKITPTEYLDEEVKRAKIIFDFI